MKRATFHKDRRTGLDVIQVPNKTIVFPCDKATSSEILYDKATYQAHVQAGIDARPALFPETIGEGWSLND